jgi:hypothetical protein
MQNQTLVPVTVKQLENAVKATNGEEPFVLDGQELQHVRLSQCTGIRRFARIHQQFSYLWISKYTSSSAGTNEPLYQCVVDAKFARCL